MKKEYLVTDLYHLEKYNDRISKRYLEIPVFDKKNKLKNNIFFKKWKSYKEKIRDHNKNVKLYKFYLEKLTIYLNKYHNKKFSKRYWEIILTPWLWFFVSSVTFKWSLISSIKPNKFIFLKKKIDLNEIIPIGIEDFIKMSTSHYWNHHIFSKIVEHSFSKKIAVKKIEIPKNIPEKYIIYKKLENKSFLEKISLLVQKLLNFLPQKKDYLIFSTTMSNIQEIKARGGRIILITDILGSKKAKKYCNQIILMPKTNFLSSPIIYSIPIQLIAYFLAVKLKRDVDKPRNLAKSVTVE